MNDENKPPKMKISVTQYYDIQAALRKYAILLSRGDFTTVETTDKILDILNLEVRRKL